MLSGFVTRSTSVREVTTEKALNCVLHNLLNNIDGFFQYPYVKFVTMSMGTASTSSSFLNLCLSFSLCLRLLYISNS